MTITLLPSEWPSFIYRIYTKSHNMTQNTFCSLYHISLPPPNWPLLPAISNSHSTFRTKFKHSLRKRPSFSHLGRSECLFFFKYLHSNIFTTPQCTCEVVGGLYSSFYKVINGRIPAILPLLEPSPVPRPHLVPDKSWTEPDYSHFLGSQTNAAIAS